MAVITSLHFMTSREAAGGRRLVPSSCVSVIRQILNLLSCKNFIRETSNVGKIFFSKTKDECNAMYSKTGSQAMKRRSMILKLI